MYGKITNLNKSTSSLSAIFLKKEILFVVYFINTFPFNELIKESEKMYAQISPMMLCHNPSRQPNKMTVKHPTGTSSNHNLLNYTSIKSL